MGGTDFFNCQPSEWVTAQGVLLVQRATLQSFVEFDSHQSQLQEEKSLSGVLCPSYYEEMLSRPNKIGVITASTPQLPCLARLQQQGQSFPPFFLKGR